MTSGRLISIAIIVITALFGLGIWYTQTRAYYEPIDLSELIVTGAEGEEIVLSLLSFEGIDADTSPLRFRGCFSLSEEETTRVIAEAAPYESPEPLIAPSWFECYDAIALGADLENGAAVAVTGTVEIARGVDRVIALYPDGRGFAWQQLNGTLE